MRSQWASKLFVFKDKQGQQYVSVTLPEDDVSEVRVFRPPVRTCPSVPQACPHGRC